MQLEEQGELPSLTSEISALQKQIDMALEEALQRKFKRKTDDPGMVTIVKLQDVIMSSYLHNSTCILHECVFMGLLVSGTYLYGRHKE